MQDLAQNVGNALTIQHQTCVDEIFKCTIFVGYGGVIFFYRCSTINGRHMTKMAAMAINSKNLLKSSPLEPEGL